MASTATTVVTLDPTPFIYRHVPKNILLILLSILFFPFSCILVICSYAVNLLNSSPGPHSPPETTECKTILVTGISMTKGLTITRLLSIHTPHHIIGADIEAIPFTSPGRYSRSISSFHRLDAPDGDNSEPYIDSLLTLIKKEKVGLWISCSSVIGAVEDGEVVRLAEREMGEGFRAVQFREDVVEKLHEKDKFTSYIQSLGLEIPSSHRCESSEDVLAILLRNQGHSTETTSRGEGKDNKFILKPIGVDDRARAQMMTLLPFSSQEKTKKHVSGLGVSKLNPFMLQRYIAGPEYCTHALVLNGAVRAFVACPSSELLMHYEALSPSSPLSQKMLDFTKKVAMDGGTQFSGHLSFDFLAEEEGQGLYPIECNPRAHTAVVLFSEDEDMAAAYSDFACHADTKEAVNVPTLVIPRMPCDSYYWIGHDVVALLLIPLLELLFGTGSLKELRQGLEMFAHHVLCWRDGTFVAWDPLPFLVLYHVYWPSQFLNALFKGKIWSRINVSTTKMFVC